MISIKKKFEHLKIELEAIKSATNNFGDDNCIGNGGFGKVYKGELAFSEGQIACAIKRLDRAFGQGDPEFWKEIIMLSLYKHENIVSLLGFCDDSGEKILVYEYASKKSLDMYLNSNDLTWVRRLKICIGAARGLAFLHNPIGTHQRVLHRDIKSSNILLDENWNARIADLGLSKFGPANQQYTFLVSNAVGTVGYCDPLYVETGLLTKESDVYSFGVVLFEVLCGRLCIGNNKHRPLTGLVRQYYEQNKMNELIFGNIKDEINPASLKAFTTIAYQCLRRDREERPTMNEILRMLERALEYQVPPTPLPPPPPPPIPPPPPSTSSNKGSIKPLHWTKTREMKGTLWDVSQTEENQSRAPEIDISEFESLFSTASVSRVRRGAIRPKPVQMINEGRAHNCEIMLTNIKIPLPDIINAIVALDYSVVNVDQVDDFIKFCPTKDEMEILKSYTGDKEMLGKSEKFFMELMKIPRIESKLRVFSFTFTFSNQVNYLRQKLMIVDATSKEIRESKKFVQIMQTILKLGNALNKGTSQGFRLDSLLKLADTRAANDITLLHYLCKVVDEKMPELMDFDKDLVHLQAASEIQLKSLAEEMQAIVKGVEKVELELDASANDGGVSAPFQKATKNFVDGATIEIQALSSSFAATGRNADSLVLYFGEDPSRCPFEIVISTLLRFIKMFKDAYEETKDGLE